ncbi:unnamed protein product [Mycena citricolor]|uniref:RING-CH-type domain-containing protein n=1 Tax=Mycena citricolor TaxID=2018698 RepID=A0AAD2Q618_9AGAR|nr:unnamed protein product [Mycena citricolor]
MSTDDRQCRICLAGAEEETTMGRMIHPCLCSGSMKYIHVKCLHRWRTTSASQSAFFTCPQCKYNYRFSRTRIMGIATNPGASMFIVGSISALFFTVVVILSSFITTFFMSWFEQPSAYSGTGIFFGSYWYYSPIDILREIIGAALRILQDESGIGYDLFESRTSYTAPEAGEPSGPPGLFRSLVRRFLLGLPIVGGGSLVHLLLSMHLLSPLHMLARWRSSRRRRESSRDVVSLVIIGLILLGAARALMQVYRWTEALTKRLLYRLEDSILEV